MTAGVDDHCAVLAWRRLRGSLAPVHGVEVLKESRSKGRAVYRITGGEPGTPAVIAKRRVLDDGFRAERLVYERLLPQGPLDDVRFHGSLEEADAAAGWLFIEDAGSHGYSPALLDHRQLAGRYLGSLHTKAQQWDGSLLLPEREGYPAPTLVQAARDPLLQARPIPRLRSARPLLDRVLANLDRVEAGMPRLVEVCQRAPRSIVHGDFVTRNLRMRFGDGALRLVSVDWETVGWGCPVCDLAQAPAPESRSWASPDVDMYWSVVEEFWPEVDYATVLEWAKYATVIRCVTVISWDAPGLLWEWPDDRLANMALYDARLARALELTGWCP